MPKVIFLPFIAYGAGDYPPTDVTLPERTFPAERQILVTLNYDGSDERMELNVFCDRENYEFIGFQDDRLAAFRYASGEEDV